MTAPTEPRAPRARTDVVRLFARALCLVFATIGALPLLGGFLVRSEPVQRWAAEETARVLKELLGVTARYDVHVSLWPLQLAIENLELPSSDGGRPAVEARRVAVTPRIFSLLAGRLDVGDIELDQPRIRLTLREGRVSNVEYHLPESEGPAPKLERAPFSSVAITDAELYLEIDDETAVYTSAVDLDVFAEAGQSFEVALRAGHSEITHRRKRERGEAALDEDVICQLDLRLRLDREGALLRRLSVLGAADADPAAGTRPACGGDEKETPEERVALRLSQVRVVLAELEPVVIDGHAMVRAPAFLANRLGAGPFTGWVGVVADVRYDARWKLPQLRGRVRGGDLGMDVYRFAERLDAEVEISGERIELSRGSVDYGHGTVRLEGVRVEPLSPGVPLWVEKADGQGVMFQDLMENIGVTDDTIIHWSLDRTVVSKFGGTLDPLRLDGDLYAEASDFEVFDKAYHDPARRHMIGVKAPQTLRGRFAVRPDSVQFRGMRAAFGQSRLFTSVAVGFDNTIRLSVGEESTLDLADASPLIDIPMSGTASVQAEMSGVASEAVLRGEVSIRDLVFAGFPLGDVEASKVRFKPLIVEVSDLRGRSGASGFRVPSARFDFDTDAALLADALVESEDFHIQDFLTMFRFDEDPRFAGIEGNGRVRARVHYDLGGRQDRCGSGYLRVDGDMDLAALELLDERYDSARAAFDFRWEDPDAGHLGMELSAPSMVLTKGMGSVLGSVALTDGARVQAHFTATEVPLSKIDALGELGRRVGGRASAVVEVSGTLDELAAEAHARVSSVRVGRATLPPSDLAVALRPSRRPLQIVGRTGCGRPMPGPFEPAEYEADASAGTFHVSGGLFGGQIRLDDLQITRQRSKVLRGGVAFEKLNLGAVAELSPALALTEPRMQGTLTGRVDIEELPLERPGRARAAASVEQLRVRRGGLRLDVEKAQPMDVRDGRLAVPGLSLAFTSGGRRGVFDLRGTVDRLESTPRADLALTMQPTDLAGFAGLLPRVDRLGGRVSGELRLDGPVTALSHRGAFRLEKGELSVRGLPAAITDAEVVVAVEQNELTIERGTASMGGGRLDVSGTMPLRGFEPGAARAVIAARNVRLPVARQVQMTVDADLEATWDPARADAERGAVPRVAGTVNLQSFEYSRKIAMSADLSALAQRGKRTKVESYDPDGDVVELDIVIRASRPLELSNNLIDAKLRIGDRGLALLGTNQRFGMRGEMALVKGGRIRLRRNEFEITEGYVRFEDSTRIAPKVDVTAVTEYQRYSDTSGAAPVSAPGASAAAATAGGQWRITMRAHGDADQLRIDLTSEPDLSQDDIFLLLTLGLTRAELDQAQSASLGQSVALETLGRLTGADEAVTENIPVIDEFGFGSAYSARTGRTEPTVTVGKQLTQRVRARVTSGVTESREIRSNLQWRLSPRVSLEGSYDNVNDISSSQLGNLGTDIRWRLEFE